jgi:hypothetical protein
MFNIRPYTWIWKPCPEISEAIKENYRIQHKNRIGKPCSEILSTTVLKIKQATINHQQILKLVSRKRSGKPCSVYRNCLAKSKSSTENLIRGALVKLDYSQFIDFSPPSNEWRNTTIASKLAK